MPKASPLKSLLDNPRVREAARALIDAVREEIQERELTPEATDRVLKEIGRLRGRPMFYPALSSGVGRGARVRLANGLTVLDFTGGIGIYGFGHSDADLLETAAAAAAADSVFQGHLLPGPEQLNLTKGLLRHTGSRIKRAWLSVSGAIANENAFKLILQKHAPADRIVAFERNFAGDTTALAEITDQAEFRDGLPLRGSTLYIPFFDPNDPESTAKSLAALDDHLKRYPGRIAAMLFELVQGKGGVRCAPREFFMALMQRCAAAGIAVWVDEVQTFARTGELFAYRTLELDPWVDVVTTGKMLQGSAVLFTTRYNPRPGLLGGTLAGSTVGLAVGVRIIERLETEGYLGPEGRIILLGRRFERKLEALRKRLPRAVGARDGVGAMQAFVPFDGSEDVVSAVLRTAFEEGLMALSAGSDPTKIRMLLPVNTTDEELEAGFTMLEKAMRRVAEEHGLPC